MDELLAGKGPLRLSIRRKVQQLHPRSHLNQKASLILDSLYKSIQAYNLSHFKE